MRRPLLVLGSLLLLAGSPAAAQDHPHHPPPEAKTPPGGAEEAPAARGVPGSRAGSGTAWQPDSTPVHGHHFMAGDWALMLHYSVFAGFDAQTTPRGAHEVTSTNWLMLMAERAFEGGTFGARAMLSAEPFTTAGPRGYPLLLQSGETAGGEPLHDRQHPHDLFMELAAQYRHPLTSELGVELYAAAAGEPALGPVAFPHRASATSDPLAPLGHHWQDSTHISFGVLTAGVFTRHLKLEASWFNGREPDEHRYGFDFRPLDSWAARLSFNPTAELSLQVSYGYLHSPEPLAPEQSVRRLTTSVSHGRHLSSGLSWTSSFVLGINLPAVDPATAAALLEGQLALGPDAIFGRAELVQKTGHDLVLAEADEQTVFPIGMVALGYVRSFGPLGGVAPGIGVRGSINLIPSELQPFYGDGPALGAMVFVCLRPAAMSSP